MCVLCQHYKQVVNGRFYQRIPNTIIKGKGLVKVYSVVESISYNV